MSSGCPRAVLHQSEPIPDPYAVYARMRADHGPVIPVELEPGVHGWLVTDYTRIISWSRDTTVFSHDSRLWRDFVEGRVDPASPLLPMMAPRMNALFVDGAEHQRYRRAITDGLGALGAGRLRGITTRYADRLIDEFCARGRADALGEYARMLPLLVMNDVLGLDEDQGVSFVTAMCNMWLGVDAERSRAEAERVLSALITAKHRHPGDDLTTRLLRHRAALSDEEVITQLFLVVAAANEPTANLVNAVLRAALADPAVNGTASLSDAVLDDLMDRVLWQDPPITHYPVLYPRVDVPIDGGRVIEAGSPVLLGFAAANHFFARENAERMEETANRAHVAWGAGPHRCPARDEATTIAVIAVRTLLTRLPGVRLAVAPEELRWQMSALSWLPVRLPIAFAPQAPPPSGPEEGFPGPTQASGDERSGSQSPGRSLPKFLARALRRP